MGTCFGAAESCRRASRPAEAGILRRVWRVLGSARDQKRLRVRTASGLLAQAVASQKFGPRNSSSDGLPGPRADGHKPLASLVAAAPMRAASRRPTAGTRVLTLYTSTNLPGVFCRGDSASLAS